MACGMGSGRAKGTGKGQGRGKGEDAMFILIGYVIVLVLLGLVKFVVGLVFRNGCPADSAIPALIAGTGGGEAVIDAVVGCVGKLVDAAKGGVTVVGRVFLIVEHLIGLICGSIYIFHNYAYLSGGCDGAEECCDQHFMKFALGVTIIEWILILFCCCCYGCTKM
ncbi:uncharacterized protein LOC128558624 [Mercenaria mercenaria]|uniref:uncharacterized protein LOC128558624 n=1 Tax=Mercenaria mercenaria TaxID=6596 RepID=UPI00234E6331|nr:uncharacterized protein LOC128558624 [Mercenaria mercenaria]XP_053404459.1 uncharacterized protein LOC128558624 [Mercenaria mercenaria]